MTVLELAVFKTPDPLKKQLRMFGCRLTSIHFFVKFAFKK